MATRYHFTGNISAQVDDLDSRRVFAFVENNAAGQVIYDATTGETLMGRQRVVTAADGTFDVELVGPSADTTPTDFQWRLIVQYRDTGYPDQIKRWTFPWFTLTADTALSPAVGEEYVPPTYETLIMGRLDDHASDLKSAMTQVALGNFDEAAALLAADDSTGFRTEMDVVIAEAVTDTPVEVVDTLVNAVLGDDDAEATRTLHAKIRDASAIEPSVAGRGILGVGANLKILASRNGGKHNAFPGLAQLHDGTLIVAWRDANEHQVVANPANSCIRTATSKDLGRTWSTAAVPFVDAVYDHREAMFFVIPSTGRLVVTYWTALSDNWVDLYSWARFSDDGGVTWSTPRSLPFNYGTNGSAISSPCAQAANGDLIAVAYGQDTVTLTRKARACRSTDGGATWTDAGLVATLPGVSFDEPFIGTLPNGNLMVLLRSDAVGPNIYKTISTDNGVTWSTPVVAFAGTGRPAWLTLASGDIVTTHRKIEGAQVTVSRVSRDGGATWSPAIPVDDENLTCTYAQMVEVADGSIATAFSAQVDNDSAYVKFGYILNGVGSTPLGDYVKPLVGYAAPTNFPAPYGQRYTDLAKTNGAIEWVNVSDVYGTSWEVAKGDTGWRRIVSVGGLAGRTTLTCAIRRIGNVVEIKTAEASAASITYEKVAVLPVGFRASEPAAMGGGGTFTSGLVVGASGYPIAANLMTQANGDLHLYGVSGQRHWGILRYFTADPWPTTLPGVAA